MSARGFKSVFMVGAVAGAALSCYLVSLKVASERAALEGVETKIVLAQRDIRLLETEIGTRGRLAQLERWNVKAIQLSSPTADQFIDNGYQLATLVRPESKPAIEAPVVLAAVPREAAPPRAATTDDDATPAAVAPRAAPSQSAGDMMHVASYSKLPLPAPRPAAPPVSAKAVTAPAKAAAAPKAVKTATADPLAPLSGAKGRAKSGANSTRTTKE